jgi:hypothetical protein
LDARRYIGRSFAFSFSVHFHQMAYNNRFKAEVATHARARAHRGIIASKDVGMEITAYEIRNKKQPAMKISSHFQNDFLVMSICF